MRWRRCDADHLGCFLGLHALVVLCEVGVFGPPRLVRRHWACESRGRGPTYGRNWRGGSFPGWRSARPPWVASVGHVWQHARTDLLAQVGESLFRSRYRSRPRANGLGTFSFTPLRSRACRCQRMGGPGRPSRCGRSRFLRRTARSRLRVGGCRDARLAEERPGKPRTSRVRELQGPMGPYGEPGAGRRVAWPTLDHGDPEVDEVAAPPALTAVDSVSRRAFRPDRSRAMSLPLKIA